MTSKAISTMKMYYNNGRSFSYMVAEMNEAIESCPDHTCNMYKENVAFKAQMTKMFGKGNWSGEGVKAIGAANEAAFKAFPGNSWEDWDLAEKQCDFSKWLLKGTYAKQLFVY